MFVAVCMKSLEKSRASFQLRSLSRKGQENPPMQFIKERNNQQDTIYNGIKKQLATKDTSKNLWLIFFQK
jgi:hypothetical protein